MMVTSSSTRGSMVGLRVVALAVMVVGRWPFM
jgi:hypothetical protein